MADRREIPPPTPDVVIPPNLDRTYFDGAADHPFRPQSAGFELVNAWWLAEAALLAYAAPGEAAPQFERGGFVAQFFQGPIEGTQAYLLVCDDFCVVAFRGTQVPKLDPRASEPEIRDSFRELLKDIVADEDIILDPIPGGGRVHRGFKRALDEIYPDLERRLNALRQDQPSRPWFFTGHSLGAALATLAAQRYGFVRALYTFGSPLVGNELFAVRFPIQSAFRIVDNNDIVARVPPVGPLAPPDVGVARYVHVGDFKYIDSHGRIDDHPGLFDRLSDALAGHIDAIARAVGRLPSGFHLDIPIDSLTDHAPLYYALRLWNAAFA